ncbi:MAG: hypothetical protein DRP78_00650 [Candidatus Omnitrophota bacterium]|nr:MAG: hypothetical protein DRP78_00650 [Candidatus Omnitrophota bacterium]
MVKQKKILQSIGAQEKRVVVIDKNGKIEEFLLERNNDNLAGNIYKGKITHVVKGMDAAFVDIGRGKNGFLYVNELIPCVDAYSIEVDEHSTKKTENLPFKGKKDIGKLLRKGQEIMVQVVKEPFGTKGCRLTSQISLPGRFLVLMPYNKSIGISKKIKNKKERVRLRSLLQELKLPQSMGCIIRTQAENKGKREFAREIKYLLRLLQEIKQQGLKSTAPCLLHQEYGLVLRTARDLFTDDIEQFIVDDRDAYKQAVNFIKILAPELKSRLVLHKEKISLFEKYDVNVQIENIFLRKVTLENGGYIVIEKTEALVSVDVNSGSFIDTSKLEQTALITNLEAAKEVARQIKLRDLAGIIIVDFIDMQKIVNQKKVLQVLYKFLENDRARINIYPFSPLGLVQIARQRIRKSVENIMFMKCPHCQGKGMIKTIQTIAIKVLRRLKYFLLTHKQRSVEITVHPLIAMRLLNEERAEIITLEKKMWRKIAIFADEHLDLEEIKFL